MTERLYSDVIANRLTKYFKIYGWSIMREAILQELLNESYKEGQASNNSNESKRSKCDTCKITECSTKYSSDECLLD